MENKNAVRCAIIGIGAQGRKYALALSRGEAKDLSLSAVCCRSEESANWAREHLGTDVKIYHGENELYGNAGQFDAVIIATPHRQHPAMTIRALKNGKHVLCDKPAGITVSDAAAMNEAAAQAGKVYAMMCNQRACRQNQRLKELLDREEIGTLVRVTQINSRNFRTRSYHESSEWRSSWKGEGGGALINQGYHLLDLWQYLFGIPESVYAEIPFGKYNSFRVDDEDTLIMRYANGMTGTFILTTGEGTWTERLEIAGTRGRIVLDKNRLTVTRLNLDAAEYAASARRTGREDLMESETVEIFSGQEDAYRIMLNNFAEAVLEGKPLIAPGTDGEKTLELINGAYMSAWLGEKVKLPVDRREYEKLLGDREEQEG